MSMMMNPTFPCNAAPLQAPSATNMETSQRFPGGHKVVSQFPKNLEMKDLVLEIQEEGNAWSSDGYSNPSVDFVNSDINWGQLKPDVADSLLTDMVLTMEENWDASAQEVICPAKKPKVTNTGPVNRNQLRQAWFPFYQTLPFPTRVHLGPCVSVPRQVLSIPFIATPKSRKVSSTRKRRRPNLEEYAPLCFSQMTRLR